MLEILLFTGLRRNELAHLRWQDVDLGRGVITVQHHGDYRTKSGKSRVIPVSQALRRTLTDLQTKQGDGENVCPIPYGSLGSRFQRLVRQAGPEAAGQPAHPAAHVRLASRDAGGGSGLGAGDSGASRI